MKGSRIAFVLFLLTSPAAAAQSATLYSTAFDSADGWTMTPGPCAGWTDWGVDATPMNHPAGPYVSPPASLNFNDGMFYGEWICYGFDACGSATSPVIDLSLASGTPRATFWASWDSEVGCEWDTLHFYVDDAVGGGTYLSACLNSFTTDEWHFFRFDLDPAWGAVRLQFHFDTIDDCYNDFTGPFIDDLAVVDLGAQFCLGDGSAGPCPCGNQSPTAEHAGCLHSLGTGGRLRVQGQPSLSADTLVLVGGTMPNQATLYFQSAAPASAAPFGDGLRCLGGPFVRLGVETNSGGGSVHPGAGDPPISARGSVLAPGTRYYAAWFRDPADFCTPSTFNLTNAVAIVWEP